MIKQIYILIFILLMAFPVSALTNLPNDNTTDTISYTSIVIDNNYSLDVSDSYIQSRVNYEISAYPYTKQETFTDSSGNTLDIIISFTKVDGYIYDMIYSTTKIKYNGVYQPFEDGTNYYFKNVSSIDILISGLYDKVELNGKIITIHPVNSFGSSFITLQTTKYFNDFTLDNSSATLTYTGIALQYRDNGISYLQSSIDEAYSSLSFPFKFIFIVVKGIIKIVQIVSAGYLIDALDVLEFQNYFLVPLTYLDYVIGVIFDILHFISTMGIIWFITIMTGIIFIHSYLKSNGDILNACSIFIKDEISFFMAIINALKWLYEKVLLAILGLIRG